MNLFLNKFIAVSLFALLALFPLANAYTLDSSLIVRGGERGGEAPRAVAHPEERAYERGLEEGGAIGGEEQAPVIVPQDDPYQQNQLPPQ